MCLDKLAKFNPCKIGYKTVDKYCDGNLWGVFFPTKPLPQNVWLKEGDYRWGWDKGKKTIQGKDCSYPFGWHVYHRKRDAIKHAKNGCGLDFCVKVAVAEPVAVGYQYGEKVTVAKRIEILGEIKS